MTGSVALDVVIGLVFIYLLYSLLATVVCEIIANYWGLRARNLLYSIGRMLEDSPIHSEPKVIALLKQIKDKTIRLFDTPEGPASCVFYRLPVIKYLAESTFQSKPSYITRQTFSKALFEIFRIYGGSDAESDLAKIRNVLDGALEHKGVLKLIRDEIVRSTTVDQGQTEQPPDYSEIYDRILEIAKTHKGRLPADATESKLFRKIRKLLKNSDKLDKDQKKEAVFEIDEMLNLFGHETRGHMRSLLKDANDDLLKFRLHLEQWFDDTQDRAAGWYKQQIQILLLLIGLVFAAFFNANTIDMVHKLSVDKDARDKMVQLASDYLKDPNSIKPNLSAAPPKDSIDSARMESMRKVKHDSLKNVQEKLQKQIDDANTLIGAGWPELPATLPLLPWTQAREDSLAKVAKNDLVRYAVIKIDVNDMKAKAESLKKKFSASNLKETVLKKLDVENNKRILVYPREFTKAVLGCIDESWDWSGETYTGLTDDMKNIKLETGFRGTFFYVTTTFFSKAFWGFLLTAIAISLGAPFWFDLLNKLMQIRGSVREPTQTQSGAVATSGSGTSDPAHPINRKG